MSAKVPQFQAGDVVEFKRTGSLETYRVDGNVLDAAGNVWVAISDASGRGAGCYKQGRLRRVP